jgi:hypothetical protein
LKATVESGELSVETLGGNTKLIEVETDVGGSRGLHCFHRRLEE